MAFLSVTVNNRPIIFFPQTISSPANQLINPFLLSGETLVEMTMGDDDSTILVPKIKIHDRL